MKKLLVLLIYTTLLYSCSTNDNKARIINENALQITVDYKKAQRVINIDSIVEIKSLVPLEKTTTLIGDIKKLFIINNKYIIWDNRGKIVWFFNKNGKYLTKISELGKGPNEYTSMEDVFITNKKTINIFDSANKNILMYDLNGLYLGKKRLKNYLSDRCVNNGYVYSFFHILSAPNNRAYHLQVSKNKKFTKGYFTYYGYWPFQAENSFIKHRGKVYFHKAYDDNIYMFQGEKLHVAFSVVFGAKAFPYKELEKLRDLKHIEEILNKQDYIGNISNIQINDSFLTFTYEALMGFVNTYVYNLKAGKEYHFSALKNEKLLINPSLPIASDKDSFFSILNPWNLSDKLAKKISEKYNIQIKAGIDVNPILIKYNYK